jgi:hypothetical protein
MRRWLLIVTALIGCATPYQPKGSFLGGYEDYEVKGRPGLHYVSFEGTTATDEDVVYRYWRQRVVEVCEGKDWQVISSGGKKGIVPIRRPRFEGYVRCGPREAERPNVAPR